MRRTNPTLAIWQRLTHVMLPVTIIVLAAASTTLGTQLSWLEAPMAVATQGALLLSGCLVVPIWCAMIGGARRALWAIAQFAMLSAVYGLFTIAALDAGAMIGDGTLLLEPLLFAGALALAAWATVWTMLLGFGKWLRTVRRRPVFARA